MNKKIPFLLSILLITLCIMGCKKSSDSQEDTVDVSMHDNWVMLLVRGFNANLSFSETDHSITSGQPWGGVSTGTNNQEWGIDAQAGRHASTSPADWFKSNCTVATCCLSNFNPGWPSKLNFAFTGTLSIGSDTYTVTFGQGNNGLGTNNWWIGGEGWHLEPSTLDVITPDYKYYFEPEIYSANEIWIDNSPKNRSR